MDLGLVERLDELAAKAVPPEEAQLMSGWVARRSPRSEMRRANSVWPRHHQQDNLADDIESCERFYEASGLATRFQISPASQPVELAEFLLARGYRAHNLTATYICDLEHVTVIAHPVSMQCEITAVPSDPWWATWTATSASQRRLRSGTAAMFEQIPTDTAFVHVSLGGEPAGIGMSVLDGEWFGIFNIETATHLRRRGVGGLVVNSLMQWAQARGARFGYVQVQALNRPALALYARAGYRTHAYDYLYLSKDPSP